MKLIEEIKLGESKNMEFKKELPNGNQLAKTVIAFSNTGGGKLIIGVDDSRNIIGIDDKDIFELQDKISSIIYDTCYPNIIPELYISNIKEKQLLVIEVYRGNLKPYYLKSVGKKEGTYIRVGSTNRKASYENILELERQKRNISFGEEIDYEVDFKDIDLTPLKEEFSKRGKKVTENDLINMKVIKKERDGIFATRALLILLGFYENVEIQCARFRGTTMEKFLDKKEYKGNIFSQLKSAEQFILNHINIKGKIDGLQREDIPEIPIEAIRESLINAFVHRDYTNRGRNIKLGIYDDMVNIVSPGSFPNTLTQEDVLNGRSEIRNKIIARVFKELGYIEQWGSGITRIFSACKRSNLKKPKIMEKNDSVDVELYRDGSKYKDKELKLEFNEMDLSDQDKELIKYLKENEKISTKEASELLEVKIRRSRGILKNLMDKGLLERKGSGPSTHYVLTESAG
ncbi:MAG: RNA-binding domain-containing protein [Fusobacteriota bacterium]